MTETEWLVCDDPTAPLRFLGDQMTDRSAGCSFAGAAA
jgi:hypothetical protein